VTVASDLLLTAIRNRDGDSVEQLLIDDPSQRSRTGPSNESLVLHACYVGAAALAPQLRGPRAYEAAEAAALGDLSAIDAALSADADVISRRTRDGWTPLHLACFFGREDAAMMLVDNGAPIDALSTNATRNTPLHAALAGACVPALVKRLIMAGADVTALGEHSITPLHIAASRGDVALCDLLIARGAKPHAAMEDGTTPAQLAAARGFSELAEKLIATA
jgi:ankyrin repeat protein